MRVRQAQSNVIQSALSKDRYKRQALINNRLAFAQQAIANKREEREGFNQMYVHQLTARKTTPPASVWASIDADYIALQSTASGSVFHFLMAVLCNGFRIFPKAGDAIQYKQQAALAEHDAALFKGLSDDDASIFSSLTCASLFNGLTTAFRGKGSDIGKEELGKRIALILVGRPSSEPRVQEVCELAVGRIMEDYGTYAEVKQNAMLCAGAIADAIGLGKTAMSHIDKAFMKIEALNERLPSDVKSATIAFDPQLSPIPFDRPADALMPLIAFYAKEYVSAGLKAKDCSKSITTTNGNGLSWLFNKGLKLFRTLSVGEIAERFSVPEAHSEALTAIKQVASAINVSSTFGSSATKDALGFVQGFIDSTISNHINRTKASLSELSDFEPITINNAPFDKDAFIACGISEEAFENALEYFKGPFKEDVDKALMLIGEADVEVAFEEARSSYERLCAMGSYLSGATRQLNNVFKNESDKQLVFEQDIPAATSLFFIGDPIEEIAADRETLLRLKADITYQFEQLMQDLVKTNKLSFTDILTRKAATFADACAATKRKALSRSQLVAARFYLSRLTSMAYRGSKALRSALYKYLLEAELCYQELDKKELREHIFNRMHFCFLSPYDTGRKKLLRLDDEALSAFDAMAAIDHLLSCEINEKDALNLNALKLTILCNGIDKLDTQTVMPLAGICHVPAHFQYLLTQEVLSGSEASTLLNAIVTSKLSGINYRLNKSTFIHRQTFKLATGNRLFLEPKEPLWSVPEGLLDSSRASVFESNYCVIDNGQLNVVETVNAIVKAGELPEKEQAKVSWLLKQIPARWFIQAGVSGWGETLNAFQVNEGKVSPVKKASGLVPIKIGARAGKLRTALNSLFSVGKSSPPTLTFERSFELIDEEVVEHKAGRQVIFNLPINQPTQSDNADWSPKYIIGIDPSETGFGVGVIEPDGTIVDSGFVHCHESVNYAKAKELHTNKTQPRQEYKKPYSNHLSKQRDIAVGEITNALDNLMLTLDGLLVFEMVNSNAAPAFRDVWETVIQRYTWGDNDAQNSRRIQHWGGASRWLTTFVDANGEQIKVFPGAKIGGANTSYPCPVCKRNALAIVKDELNVKQTVSVNDGELVIGEHTLEVFEPDKDSMQHRKTNQLTPLFVPATRIYKDATTTNTNGKDLVRMIARSIRRSPAGRNSSLSTISQYHCVFTDCEATGNADGFAAINIARKYADNKIQGMSA